MSKGAKDMPGFDLKKYHKNRGHEGEGFDCELWMDGVLVAHVTDEGGGGAPLYRWASREMMLKLDEHIKTLPPEHVPAQFGMEAYDRPIDRESFIWSLVTRHEEMKRWKRACKTKTLFRLASDGADKWREMKVPFSPAVAEQLRKRFGDDLLCIINETIGDT